MIIRLTPETLRKIADQLDALTALEAAGARHVQPNTQIVVDGTPLAYTYWWEDRQRYLAEIISFTPGDAAPLAYHDDLSVGPRSDVSVYGSRCGTAEAPQ